MIDAVCLSIWQPWAWAIVSGYKDVENRTWGTKYRGRLLIHASKHEDRESIDWVMQMIANRIGVDKSLVAAAYEKRRHRGAIVGEVQLLRTCQEHPSKWFFGPTGFVLGDALRYQPVKCRGFMGLFAPPEGLSDDDLVLDNPAKGE